MIVVKIQEQPGENGGVRVNFSVGETEGNAFSFAVEDAGTLEMSTDVWDVLRKAIQNGARRPLIVMLEKSGGA